MIEVRPTSDYEELVPFFMANELEFSKEDPTPTDLIRCWKATDGDRLIGGFVLAKRDGEYICDGIAVDPDYRNEELGRAMLKLGMEEAARRGASRMYLVARAPGFFRKEGFKEVAREDAPDFFECLTCDQYGVTCFPEVMKRDL